MPERKRKGDLAELMVAADLARQGHRLAFPYGEDWDYDLLLVRGERFERVQGKYASSRDGIVQVRARTQSITRGRVIEVRPYTSACIDWLAAYDATTGGCFYIPAADLGEGMMVVTLRLEPARNGQIRGVRMAADYRAVPLL
jgi:hypothetical protein